MSVTLSRRALAGCSIAPIEALERRVLLSTVVVNTVVDAIYPAGSGQVSLRNAIADANGSSSPTTITFNPTVFATAQTIMMNGNELELSNTSQATTIVGPSAGVVLNAGAKSSVFTIDGGVTASISNVTATNASGGAINNNGTLTLDNSTISNSTTTPAGGGMDNSGTATLTDDTISGNKAYFGGGIINNGGITITDTTFAGDISTGEPQVYGNAGAGIYDNGTATLVNDTFSGDSGLTGNGVYAWMSGSLTLTNCTISANSGGSGIFNAGSATDFTIVNSIVAGNLAQPSTVGDGGGSFNSLGYNIIGEADGSSGWNADDRVGSIASPLNPALGALGSNGGPTQTMLPLTGSPALDNGSVAYVPADITTDQRGLPRTVDNTVDIGAVETQKAINISAPAAQTAVPGTAKLFTLGSFTQTGTSGPYAVTVNWGDGSSATTLSQNATGIIIPQSHTYASAGSDTVTVTVTDTTGKISGDATFSVTLAAIPQIAVTAPAEQTALITASTTLSLGGFSQTGTTGPYTVDVSWGDGTADTTFTANTTGTIAAAMHAFVTSGTEIVIVTVTDSTGTVTGDASFSVAVTTGSTPTTTSLQASNTTVQSAVSITLTATVSPTDAIGVVTFLQNDEKIQEVAVSGGIAMLTTTALGIGDDTLTAMYSGSATYASSTSAPVSVTVLAPPNTTTLSLLSSATNVNTSQSVTLTAIVSPASSGSTDVTGSVTYYQGGTVLGVVTLPVSGAATLTTTTGLPVGADPITATYSGDVNFSPSTAAATVITVTPTTTATALSLSSTSKTLAQAVTLAATVGPAVVTSTTLVKPLAAGSVTFAEDGTVIGTANVGAGDIATLTTTDLPLGADSITASYSGDGSFSSSVSPAEGISVITHALVPTILKANLPVSAIGGSKIHGSIAARLTNELSNTENDTEIGVFSVQVFASASTMFYPGSDALVATVSRNAKIRGGKSIPLAIPITSLPASLDGGTYHLLLLTTDPLGNTEEIDTGLTIIVTAPVISLAVSFAALPENAIDKGATVALVDNGNINDSSTFTAVIGISTDASGQNIVASGSGIIHPVKLSLRPGHVSKVHVTGWESPFSSLAAGTYYLTVTLTDADGHSASVVSAQSV